MTLKKCKKCSRWEYVNGQGLCENCRVDEPEKPEANDGNALFGDDE